MYEGEEDFGSHGFMDIQRNPINSRADKDMGGMRETLVDVDDGFSSAKKLADRLGSTLMHPYILITFINVLLVVLVLMAKRSECSQFHEK